MSDGSVTIDTRIDTSGFEKDLDGLAYSAKKGLSVITVAVAATGAAMAALAIDSITVGTNFEAAMSEVAAISDATAEDLDALTNKAKEIGAVTKFSATDAAGGLKYMAAAGWDTSDMLNGLGGVMNLAAASGEDLAEVSDIVTNAITAFGLEASDSGRFADVLAQAANRSNASVRDLGYTFKYVAPVAGALGYSIEDVSVAIGTMANSGIKGEQAGTILRAVLSRMAKPTDEVAMAMKRLGLSLTDSEGRSKTFAEILDDMRGGFGELTKEQKATYAAMLGGQEAMAGILAIVNASEEDFQGLADAIYNADGAAAAVAETMEDNLQGKLNNLESAMEDIQIKIYEGLEEPLKAAADTATDSFRAIGKSMDAGALKSAMDKIGTALQKLTKKIADAAEKAIPALAEGFAWLVDNGNELIGTIAAIYAGIGTFKIIQTVSGWWGTAALQVSLFTAANSAAAVAQGVLNGTLTISETLVALLTGKITLATAAQAAWNAVIAANPIGLLITAIAVLAAGIITYVAVTGDADTATNQLKERVEELAQSTQDMVQAAKDAAVASQEVKKRILDEDVAAQSLSKRLSELQKKTNKTIAEKQEMAAIVEKLNEMVPGLALAYDAETDSLSKTAGAIDDYIEAKKQEMLLSLYMEDYARLAQDRITFENQLTEALKVQTEAQNAYNAELANYNLIARTATDGIILYGGGLQAAEEALTNANTAVSELNAQMAANTQATAENDASIKAASDALSGFTVAQEEAAAATEAVIIGNYDMSEAIKASGIEADEAARKYLGYADDTENAFSRIREDSKLTVAEMTKNLEENQKTVDEWSQNLSTLAERGLSGGLIQRLRDAGPEAASTVKELVKASDTELGKLDEVFKNGSEVATQALLRELGLPDVINSGAKMVDDIAAGVENNPAVETEAKQLIQDTKTAAVAEIQNSNFSSLGLSIAQGIAQGIRSGTSSVASAVAQIIRDALSSGRKEADVHSPSKLFEKKLGEPMIEGIPAAFNKKAAEVMRSMENTVLQLQQHLSDTVAARTAPQSYGAGSDEKAQTGEVIIQVTVEGAPINSALDADEVGRRIGAAAAKEMRLKGVLMNA